MQKTRVLLLPVLADGPLGPPNFDMYEIFGLNSEVRVQLTRLPCVGETLLIDKQKIPKLQGVLVLEVLQVVHVVSSTRNYDGCVKVRLLKYDRPQPLKLLAMD